MKKKGILLLVASLLIGVLLFAGCGQKAQPAPDAGSQTTQEETGKVEAESTAGYQPGEKVILDSGKLEVEAVNTAITGGDLQVYLKFTEKGDPDYNYKKLVEAITATQDNEPLKVVATAYDDKDDPDDDDDFDDLYDTPDPDDVNDIDQEMVMITFTLKDATAPVDISIKDPNANGEGILTLKPVI